MSERQGYLYMMFINTFKPSVLLWDIDKQYRPRSDAAKRPCLLKESSIRILIKMKTLKTEMNLSN